VLGAVMALDLPFGIGPLQFNRCPHNSYLNAFMSGGWLSGLCYPTLVLLTLLHGLRCVFVAAPWRPITIAVYAAFIGAASESVIIDGDNWRHYFLLLGMLWGLIIATRAHAAMPATASFSRRCTVARRDSLARIPAKPAYMPGLISPQ
jgi:hypothetical protein